jgi:hypothetical protein
MVNKTYKHNGLCSKLNKAKDTNEAQSIQENHHQRSNYHRECSNHEHLHASWIAIITENVAIMNICMQAG